MASGHVRLDNGTIIRAAHRLDELVIRIERPSGLGWPLYEVVTLTRDEARALKTVLAFKHIDDAIINAK